MTFRTARERTNYIINQIDEMLECIGSKEDAEEVKNYISGMYLQGYITEKRWIMSCRFANENGKIAEIKNRRLAAHQ